MKTIMKKLILFTLLFLFYSSNSFADNSYFIDFGKVLNKSKAGAQAQIDLKKRFETESSKFKKQESDLRKEESEIVEKKKIINKEKYKTKEKKIRKKVTNLQKNKKKS